MGCSGRTKGMNGERRTQLAASNSNANARHGTLARFKGDDIAERLLDLAAGVVRLLPSLGKQPGAAGLVKQLERCAPAGGANYEEARGAESPADFVHKVRIALKEVRETRPRCRWLRKALVAGGPEFRGLLLRAATSRTAASSSHYFSGCLVSFAHQAAVARARPRIRRRRPPDRFGATDTEDTLLAEADRASQARRFARCHGPVD